MVQSNSMELHAIHVNHDGGTVGGIWTTGDSTSSALYYRMSSIWSSEASMP